MSLVCFGLFALLWNGMLSVFVIMIFSGPAKDTLTSLLAIAPFVLVGIALAGFAITPALQLLNPRPFVTVSSPVALGQPIRLEWSMKGRLTRLARLRLTLEGREEATYHPGRRPKTVVNMFMTIPIADQIAPRIESRGSARVTIPAGAMHSFDAAHNRIVWTIRVRGDVPRWPDSDDEFPITVGPRPR